MRIWVTGIGVVSPLALGAGATMDRLVRGERGFRALSLFEMPGSRCALAAEVHGLPPIDQGDGTELLSRTDQMAVLAAQEALSQAGLDLATGGPLDLVLGGTTSGLFETEALLADMARDPSALKPLRQMLSHPLSATVDRMQRELGRLRRARTLCSACSSGANAMVLAASWLQAGQSDRVLAGGADGLSRLTFAGFHSLGALSPEPCRPFDRRRKGLTLGEGAAFFVLETERAAKERGAAPLCELRGWAVGSEHHHITNPEPSGQTAARLMQQAIARAGLQPKDIDYVNAHGTATPHNDEMEARALTACFGAELERIAVSSSKGQLGHTLGAAGAIEAAISAMALARGLAPPTKGLEEIDPACAMLRHVLETEPLAMRAVLSSSFGFGGMDTVLVLSRPDAFPPHDARAPRKVVVTAAATVGPLGVLATEPSAAYLQAGEPARSPIAFEAAEHLEIERARRMDRPSRLATAAIQAALRDAGAHELAPADASRAGALLGSAYGPVDRSAAYVQRVFERGAKGAMPAVFPNLVPSSPVAHASIYLGLGGPVFCVSDLAASAESAMATAVSLLATGEADLVAAGSVEELSAIAEQVLGPLCAAEPAQGTRSEGGGVVLFEAEPALRARAAAAGRAPRAIAELLWCQEWRGDLCPELASLPAPDGLGKTLVVLGQEGPRARALLERTSWARVARHATAPRCGYHEGAGGIAVAAAVGVLAQGGADAVLALGLGTDRGFALPLGACQPAGASKAP